MYTPENEHDNGKKNWWFSMAILVTSGVAATYELAKKKQNFHQQLQISHVEYPTPTSQRFAMSRSSWSFYGWEFQGGVFVRFKWPGRSESLLLSIVLGIYSGSL